MLNIHGIIHRLSLGLLFTALAGQALAADADIRWLPKTIKGGFTIHVPSINHDALVSEIARLKGALTHDKQLLSVQVEQKRFKDKDTLLAALLPGGLLYAAYKKNAHTQAVQRYELASSRLKEVTTDLASFTTIDGPVLLARAR